MPERYTFDSIFNYNAANGTITLNYPVIINGTRYNQGTVVTRSAPFIGGLNLFNYLGREVRGTFNPQTREVSVEGFYYA